jgi:hypothetical protein
MLGSGIAEGVAGNAIWTTAMGAAKRIVGRLIEITSSRPGELLQNPQPLGNGSSYAVRGKLKRLPRDHEIWLLREDEQSGEVRPQGFSAVQFDPHSGEWFGRVTGPAGQTIKIVALVAPPTSQDFFRYYQAVGSGLPRYEPRRRVPLECKNRASVQARLP